MSRHIKWRSALCYLAGMMLMATSAQSGDWSISLWGGAPVYVYPFQAPPIPVYQHPYNNYDYYEYEGSPADMRGADYYPSYRPWNPVERRDVYQEGGYAPDGTYHGENITEDRHSSYYSPGRNEAISQPRTTVENWNYGPGMNVQRERTTWIGADGRPHSTTVDRNTAVDPWGNTQTDTHVDLKKMPVSQTPQQLQPISSVNNEQTGQPSPMPPANRYQPTQRRPSAMPSAPRYQPSWQPQGQSNEPLSLMPKPSRKSATGSTQPSMSPVAPVEVPPQPVPQPLTNIESPPSASPAQSGGQQN